VATEPGNLRSRVGRWLRVLVLVSAFAYPCVLLAVCLAFRFIGEHWWVTAAALYLPRLVFAAPLPVLVALLLLLRARRHLWTQLVAGLVLLLPLLGLVLPWPRSQPAQTLKLLSFNVNSRFAGDRQILEQILAAAPDVVLMQEVGWGTEKLLADLRVRYPHTELSTQFIIASRFPILSSDDPARLRYGGQDRSPRFMRHVLATPFGKVAIYNVHPLSPRGVLNVHRFRELLHVLRTGAMLGGDPASDVRGNTELRALQIQTIAASAASEKMPVLIAGDLNLPGLSALFGEHLASYRDGFRDASWGFGYTFPVRWPLMRLDHILASSSLRFSSFQTGCRGVSDHLCVIADVGPSEGGSLE
jgi:vancomycin resistance protein VanJ